MIPHEALRTDSNHSDNCMMLLRPGQRLLLMCCILLLCWVVCNVINGFILHKFGLTTRSLRIAAILQSMIQIITPAILTAVLVSRRPARFLAIDRLPNSSLIFLGICVLIVSVPLFNLIIYINQSMHLPESMSGFEAWMRRMEDNADNTISIMQGGKSVIDLIMSILIIGILAGLGEELLFRGTIQRMLTTGGINTHVAIWGTAVLFSAVHMQFFGFFPRLLLGAFFGYLLFWSGTLWLPVLVHTANNIIYVVTHWIAMRAGHTEIAVDTAGTDGDWVMVLTSAVLSVATIFAIYYHCRRRDRQ